MYVRNLNIDCGGDDKYESDVFLYCVVDFIIGFFGVEFVNVFNEVVILSVCEGKDFIDINDIEVVLEK